MKRIILLSIIAILRLNSLAQVASGEPTPTPKLNLPSNPTDSLQNKKIGKLGEKFKSAKAGLIFSGACLFGAGIMNYYRTVAKYPQIGSYAKFEDYTNAVSVYNNNQKIYGLYSAGLTSLAGVIFIAVAIKF